VLDSAPTSIQNHVMDFPALHSALAEHFGVDADITSPEDESEAWKSIVGEHRRGAYPGLVAELSRLLASSDAEIVSFLRSCAPAWMFDSPSDARRGVEVFHSYVIAYSE
jgi:hypothetical protein